MTKISPAAIAPRWPQSGGGMTTGRGLVGAKDSGENKDAGKTSGTTKWIGKPKKQRQQRQEGLDRQERRLAAVAEETRLPFSLGRFCWKTYFHFSCGLPGSNIKTSS